MTRGRKAKKDDPTLTLAAVLQYGSGMVAYVSRIPELEYTKEEAGMLASASSDVLGTMSSKQAKMVSAFLAKWSPWLTLGGVVFTTTYPKVQIARTVLANRRIVSEVNREIHNPRYDAPTGNAAFSAESPVAGMGVEVGNDNEERGRDGSASVVGDSGDGARGVGIDS